MICFAATAQACSSKIGGETLSPCHFSIVTIGNLAITSSAAASKPPSFAALRCCDLRRAEHEPVRSWNISARAAEKGAHEWKNAGIVSQLKDGPIGAAPAARTAASAATIANVCIVVLSGWRARTSN